MLSVHENEHNSVALKVGASVTDALARSGSKNGGSFRIPAVRTEEPVWAEEMITVSVAPSKKRLLPSVAPKAASRRATADGLHVVAPKALSRRPTVDYLPVVPATPKMTAPIPPKPRVSATPAQKTLTPSKASAQPVQAPARVRKYRPYMTASENDFVETHNDFIQDKCKETNPGKEVESFCSKIISKLVGNRTWAVTAGKKGISQSVLSKLEVRFASRPADLQKQLEALVDNKKTLKECAQFRRLNTRVYRKYQLDDSGHAKAAIVTDLHAKECQTFHDQLAPIWHRLIRGRTVQAGRAAAYLKKN